MKRKSLATVDLDLQHDANDNSTIERPSTLLRPPLSPDELEAQALIEEARRRQRRRRRIGFLVFLVAALVGALTFVVVHSSTKRPGTSPSTTNPLVTTSLSVTRCPTIYAVSTQPTSTSTVPSTLTTSLPRSVVGLLAYYIDQDGVGSADPRAQRLGMPRIIWC